MKAIWKFPFEPSDVVTLKMPFGAEVLHVDTQNGSPCLWALVDTENSVEPRRFLVVGTGLDAEDCRAEHHLGTILMRGGSLVLHVFEDEP